MAELKCSDGTVIKISKETEQELRRAFEPKKKCVKVWTFRAEPYIGSGEETFYRIGLITHLKEQMDCVESEIPCSEAFNKKDIQRIIKGLTELIA